MESFDEAVKGNESVEYEVSCGFLDLMLLPSEEGALYQDLITINNSIPLRHTLHRRKRTTTSGRDSIPASATDEMKTFPSEGSV